MGNQFDDEIEEELDEEIEVGMSEEHAQRIVQWLLDKGHSKEEAYEALAYVMGATVEQQGIKI